MKAEDLLAEALEYLDGVRSTYKTQDSLRDAWVLMARLRNDGLVLRAHETGSAPKPASRSGPQKDVDSSLVIVLNGRGLTPKQIFQTRRLLRLSIKDLAREAGLSSSSVSNCETEGVGVSTSSLDAIEAAFEGLGVTVKRV